MKLFWEWVLRNQDNGGGNGGGSGAPDGGGNQGAQGAADGGGLAGAAAAAAGAAAGASGADGGAADAGAAADAWFPKDLDASLKGKDPGETLANVAKHLSEMPKPPAEAKDYAFKPADAIAAHFGTQADNAVLDVFRDVAHKHGMTQVQFEGSINAFYGGLIDKGLMPAPVRVEDEFTALGGADGDPAARIKKGADRVLAMRDHIQGLATAKIIGDEDAAALVPAFTSAKQVIAMERILAKLAIGGGGAANGGSAGDGAAAVPDDVAKQRRMYPTMYP